MSGTGDCFRWALWDAVNNGGTLVHGWTNHPETGTYAHAWVERAGKVDLLVQRVLEGAVVGALDDAEPEVVGIAERVDAHALA